MKPTYGDAWENFPIEPGEVWAAPNDSRVTVYDIFDPLPAWMRADLLFVDLPYNRGQLGQYYDKAGLRQRGDYNDFSKRLFECVSIIGAQTVYIEIGQSLWVWFKTKMGRVFPHVQYWEVTYYRKYPTYLLRSSYASSLDFDYTGMDEAKCIYTLAKIEDYQTIADPCMGRGLVGLAAYAAGKPFVGTELNKRRLAVLLQKLAAKGADVHPLTEP